MTGVVTHGEAVFKTYNVRQDLIFIEYNEHVLIYICIGTP
jgi:hypothetical protein